MPKVRPSTSGYARIVQAEDEEDVDEDYEEDDYFTGKASLTGSTTQYAPIQPGRMPRMHSYQGTRSRGFEETKNDRPRRRNRSSSTVDIKAINARLERWAEEIASKFKIKRAKGKTLEEEKLEIHYSVFHAPEEIRPATAETLVERFGDESEHRMTKVQFDDVVESVRVAIELGTQPKMITQGSSGSYFARNSEGKVVGVFKPKDEEPYASKNPKWTKWIHRNLFPFAFGRACLIPNLSYVSEAAAYVLDARLQTHIVPYTDVVYFTSPVFNYDYWDRRAYYRKKKPLPPKVGSLQVFLKGFQDATIFLKQHPWPDQTSTTLRTDIRAPKKGRSYDCRKAMESSDEEEYEVEPLRPRSRSRRRQFWTEPLQLSFREELEKLVILDYIMRNTDRGLDNWMIRIDEETQKATLLVEPPKTENMSFDDGSEPNEAYMREQPMSASGATSPRPPTSTVRLGAIDNSLSWPWKHPDAWRSFPFGWLFLPVSLIGQPFTERTRQHFLPLLTSKQWWSETQVALRKCFMQDADFQEKMFAKQIAVMKGQAWNVVETLKIHDHGPLELTRRTRVLVWDDLVDIPVAQPMRSSTDETRGIVNHNTEHDGDLGAGKSLAPPASHAALTPGVSDGDLHTLNRFNTSRQDSPEQTKRENEDGDISLHPSPGEALGSSPRAGTGERTAGQLKLKRTRPDTRRSRTRHSYDEPRSRWLDDDSRNRTYSFSMRRAIDENEEDDGDLSFAAAWEQEGKTKKVIVERLETVKSKNPVFTWC